MYPTTYIHTYIHSSNHRVGVECGASCNNGEALHLCWGGGPPASQDPTARFQGRMQAYQMSQRERGMPMLVRDKSYIHDTSKNCMILTSGVKRCA